MNKTVTINISGIIFHIEEDAYQQLNSYLNALKNYFAKTESGDEILQDIEIRIAELLQKNLNSNKQVIVLLDVNEAITTMGKIEDIINENAEGEAKKDTNQQNEHVKRRLFRNPDEKAIGGVCSGIANYLNIDTVWVRLAMFLLIFFGGLSAWIYLILWMIIPIAKTTAEKLSMRGEPITINNISKSIKDEAQELKTKYGNTFKKSDYSERIKNNLSSSISTIANIFTRLFGLIILMLGGLLLLTYIGTILGISVANSSNSYYNWRQIIFDSGKQYALAIIALLIIFGVPIITLIYGGIKLLFKIKYSNRWLNLSLLFLWITGIIIGSFVALNTLKDFSKESIIKETKAISFGDTLYIKSVSAAEIIKPNNYSNHEDIVDELERGAKYCIAEQNNKLELIGRTELDIVESESDSTYLEIIYKSKSETKKAASELAKKIKFSYTQNTNSLLINEIYACTQNNKFRTQNVKLILKLAKGKCVYLDENVKYNISDIDNISKTLDEDMAKHYWKMSNDGLICTNCSSSEKNNDSVKIDTSDINSIKVDKQLHTTTIQLNKELRDK
ncbi:MAG: PspC domain-containing protein [Bacteroidetes bacterium]|nr:PspC domain-containing protein [Bacteroidota bacterium]